MQKFVLCPHFLVLLRVVLDPVDDFVVEVEGRPRLPQEEREVQLGQHAGGQLGRFHVFRFVHLEETLVRRIATVDWGRVGWRVCVHIVVVVAIVVRDVVVFVGIDGVVVAIGIEPTCLMVAVVAVVE